MPETAAETCCGLFVSHFRNRYVCPRCGDVWVWDEDAVEWVPTALNDGTDPGEGGERLSAEGALKRVTAPSPPGEHSDGLEGADG